MKSISTGLLATALASVLVFVLAVCISEKAWPESMLSGASLLVGVATITSIVFAVFSFYEYRALAERVVEIRAEIETRTIELGENLDGMRKEMYDSADVLYQDMFSVLFSSTTDSPEFRASVNRIAVSVARINIESGDAHKLRDGVSSLFKYDKAEFLRIETRYLRLSERLTKAEKSQTIKHYATLKDIVLKTLSPKA